MTDDPRTRLAVLWLVTALLLAALGGYFTAGFFVDSESTTLRFEAGNVAANTAGNTGTTTAGNTAIDPPAQVPGRDGDDGAADYRVEYPRAPRPRHSSPDA